MGEVTRPVGGKGAAAPTSTALSLPTKRSTPLDNFGSYTTLIYGEKKVGKTTLASQFPDTIFLMFEPGGKALSIFKRDIKNWIQFKGYLDLLEKDATFKTIVIDTIEAAYESCFEFVCKKEGMEHPSEEEWGAGWKAIQREFGTVINRLLHIGKGVIFIGHARKEEVKGRGTGKYTHLEADMGKQASKLLTAVVDNWFYYGYDESERVLVIRGNDFVGAGTRVRKHFLTKNGKQVQTISMGDSEEEAYANLMAAFNNQAEKAGESYKPEKE